MAIFPGKADPYAEMDRRLREMEGKLQQTTEQLTRATNAMQQQSQATTGQINTLMQAVQASRAPGQQQAAPAAPATPQMPSEEELSQMTEVQKFQLMLDRVNDSLGTKLTEGFKPYGEQLQSIAQMTANDRAKASIDAAAAKYKDFWDWAEEIKAIGGRAEGRGLSIEQRYILAKGENPEKAKQLDVKYNPPAADKNHVSEYPGLLSVTDKPEDDGTLGFDDAFKEAYSEMLEKDGGLSPS